MSAFAGVCILWLIVFSVGVSLSPLGDRQKKP